MMGREGEIIKERLRKIEELRKQRISPYAYRFDKKDNCDELQRRYKKLAREKSGKKAIVAGRIMSIRNLGKIIFAKLQDSSFDIQVVLQKDKTPKKQIEFFNRFLDIGDIIGVEGKIFKTKRGELSVLVNKLGLLTKSIKPLPSEYFGLKDKEERYRKRYIDLIMNPKIKEIFETRAKILDLIREFMKKNNFIEVETPILQSVYGGASAKPFKTHCDAFNSNLYLSIAPELYLKRCLIGGFERVYEITKKFRNEGVDRQHNPEHMTIEWYQAYADYEDGMRLFEELIKFIAKKLCDKLIIEYQGKKIDLRKWKKISLLDAIKKYLNEDIRNINDENAKKIAQKHDIDPKGITKINLPDELIKLFRDKLIQPTFLIDYPASLAPLAKSKKSDNTKAEIFQPFIGGMELARAYSELTDPALQEEHFIEQEKEREAGNIEAMPTDRDFVESLKHAMPPACGVGIGIERLVMLFTNQPSIRDVILFPFMKPLE